MSETIEEPKVFLTSEQFEWLQAEERKRSQAQFQMQREMMRIFGEQSGITLRDMIAAKCPLSAASAYETWASMRPTSIFGDPGFRDSLMYLGLQDEKTRQEFFEWLSALQYEFADAMLAARSPNTGYERE